MNKIKVLLVDDEEGFRKLIGMLIRDWGYDLIEASNGKEAIDALTNKHPNIIILDYLMPDIDGITLLRGLRKINNDIPVIMFSAYPNGQSIRGAKELGVSDYIPKLSVYLSSHVALKKALHTIEKNLDKKKMTEDK